MSRRFSASLLSASLLSASRALRVAPSSTRASLGLSAAALPTSRLRGGAHFLSAAAAEAPAVQEKFRSAYTPPAYRIDKLSLNFDIHEVRSPNALQFSDSTCERPSFFVPTLGARAGRSQEETVVTSKLTVLPGDGAGAGVPFDLDGEDLSLRSISLNGTPLSEGTDYALTADGLSVLSPPHTDGFELETVVAIEPHKNTQLSGLYKSSGMYVTQCEAEGFRRITYFQDRPDVMATYEVCT
jgi:hypothetical protein